MTRHPHLTREALVVVADLGRLRAFRVLRRGDDPQERDHLVEAAGERFEDVGGPIRDTVTDQSGRFGQRGVTGLPGGSSAGEEHNVESERERKSLERLAERIAAVVAAEGHPFWMLAAPQTILASLEEALPQPCRRHLSSTLGADLSREPLAKLEQRLFAAD